MLIFQTLSVAKFLVHIPGWVIVAYLSVAAAMTIGLLIQFLLNARTRRAGTQAWLILLILFFPLAALSVIWPITLPFAIYALWKERQKSAIERSGFPVVRR